MSYYCAIHLFASDGQEDILGNTSFVPRSGVTTPEMYMEIDTLYTMKDHRTLIMRYMLIPHISDEPALEDQETFMFSRSLLVSFALTEVAQNFSLQPQKIAFYLHKAIAVCEEYLVFCLLKIFKEFMKSIMTLKVKIE